MLNRLFAAAPDLVTAAVFLVAWMAPAIPGPEYVNDLVLAMFMAAFVIFAGVVYTMLVKAGGSRIQNAFVLLMMAAVSMLILINFLNENTHPGQRQELDFTITQPVRLLPFLWMYASQFLHLLFARPRDPGAEARRMETLSTLSVAAYVGSFLAAAALPLAPHGITPEFVASLHRGDDMWGVHVYIPIAFGAFYFGLQALIKFALGAPAPRVARVPG